MNYRTYSTLYRIGGYLIMAGVVLFAAIDYPEAIVTTPSANLDSFPVFIITISPLSILYVPGLTLMFCGALLSRYCARRLQIPNRFNRVRILLLLGLVLLANLFYNWLFTNT